MFTFMIRFFFTNSPMYQVCNVIDYVFKVLILKMSKLRFKRFTNSSDKIEPDDTMESSPAEMIPSYCQNNFLAENTEEIN